MKQVMSVEEAIRKSAEINKYVFRVQQKPIMFDGDKKKCKEVFIEIFKNTDKTITTFKYLPEYDLVIDWLTEEKEKGLFLYGSQGRGKSRILNSVIPVIFMMHNIRFRPFSSIDLIKNTEILDTLEERKVIAVDDIGKEATVNHYGNKYEAFINLIYFCESSNKMFLGTTNMNYKMLNERYGFGTVDRISGLCKIVEFIGDSLRPVKK